MPLSSVKYWSKAFRMLSVHYRMLVRLQELKVSGEGGGGGIWARDATATGLMAYISIPSCYGRKECGTKTELWQPYFSTTPRVRRETYNLRGAFTHNTFGSRCVHRGTGGTSCFERAKARERSASPSVRNGFL